MLNTAADIATMVGGEIVGDDRREVREFSRIQESSEGALALSRIQNTSSISEYTSFCCLVQRIFPS